MNNKKVLVQSPKIPTILSEISINDEIEHEQYITMGRVMNGKINVYRTDKLYVEKMHFINVSFENQMLRNVEFTDVIFEKCDLSNVDFSDSIIHRVEFIDCKIIGGNLSGSALRNVLFDRCLANYVAFGFSNCKQTRFNNSSLINADFYESKFNNVEFEQCNINKSNFAGTKLKGIDLSSCSFENLVITFEILEGCIVSPEQAIGFSKALGLIIKEL